MAKQRESFSSLLNDSGYSSDGSFANLNASCLSGSQERKNSYLKSHPMRVNTSLCSLDDSPHISSSVIKSFSNDEGFSNASPSFPECRKSLNFEQGQRPTIDPKIATCVYRVHRVKSLECVNIDRGKKHHELLERGYSQRAPPNVPKFRLIPTRKEDRICESSASTLLKKASSTGTPLVNSGLACTPTCSKSRNVLLKILEQAEYILVKVFVHLSSSDLVRVSHVCKKFRNAIFHCSFLNAQRSDYLEAIHRKREKIGKENYEKDKKSEVHTCRFSISSPRKHLQQLQNVISPKKALTSSQSLFDRFVKEGKKLLPGEVQQKCTKCQSPARVVDPEFKAVCTSEKCQFVYCTRCFLAFHSKQSECLILKPRGRITSTSSKIIAKACKKRLRRL